MKILPTRHYEMYTNVTKLRGQIELPFTRVQPVTSNFNVPDSDDDDAVDDNSHSKQQTAISTDEQIGPIDAKHPKYLETFLKRSRLHYLSTTAVAKKIYVQELRENTAHRQLIHQRREQLKGNVQRNERDYAFQINNDNTDRIYMHIDMDCFFVSVVTRNRPELRDQPIAVTHSSNGKNTTNTVRLSYCIYCDTYSSRIE
jgi:hypothetical protein